MFSDAKKDVQRTNNEMKIFVNHSDGFTMQYNNPENSAYINSRLQLVRKHFVRMSKGFDVESNASLPAVPCPASETGALER